MGAKDTEPHLLYFLLHVLQLALPLPPLDVEPLQQLGSFPRPVPLAVLQTAAQVHRCRVRVLQEPPLLFSLPTERRRLTALLLQLLLLAAQR